MTERYTRRNVVRAISSIAGITATAGCLGATDYPQHRDLGFRKIEIVDRTEDKVIFEVTPRMSWVSQSKEWGTFHNVTLLGFDKSGERVCRRRLGDVRLHGAGERMTQSCHLFPHTIRYRADEQPCAEKLRSITPNTLVRRTETAFGRNVTQSTNLQHASNRTTRFVTQRQWSHDRYDRHERCARNRTLEYRQQRLRDLGGNTDEGRQ